MTKSYQELLQSNIIELMGLEALPGEQKDALISQMQDLITIRVSNRVTEEMSDEDVGKLAEFENNPAGAMEFLANSVPGFEGVVQDEIVKLKAEMAAVAEGIK